MLHQRATNFNSFFSCAENKKNIPFLSEFAALWKCDDWWKHMTNAQTRFISAKSFFTLFVPPCIVFVGFFFFFIFDYCSSMTEYEELIILNKPFNCEDYSNRSRAFTFSRCQKNERQRHNRLWPQTNWMPVERSKSKWFVRNKFLNRRKTRWRLFEFHSVHSFCRLRFNWKIISFWLIRNSFSTLRRWGARVFVHRRLLIGFWLLFLSLLIYTFRSFLFVIISIAFDLFFETKKNIICSCARKQTKSNRKSNFESEKSKKKKTIFTFAFPFSIASSFLLTLRDFYRSFVSVLSWLTFYCRLAYSFGSSLIEIKHFSFNRWTEENRNDFISCVWWQ